MKRLTPALAALALAAFATPASAIVGGQDASEGQFPAVANISIDLIAAGFGCTGTLIAPQWVLTAGHCGSVTGEVTGSPLAWPAPLYDVQLGTVQADGPAQFHHQVDRVVIEPDYLLTNGYDVTLLHLADTPAIAPTKVAGAGERDLWDVGDLETIAGFGTTSSGGDAPDTMQWAQVPIVSDADCAKAYGESNRLDGFDPATMVCAGYLDKGGVDTCQGDSGGPLYGHTTVGDLRVVGATSWGSGCADPGFPGVYARVADDAIRNWIASVAPEGVQGAGTSAAAKARAAKRSRRAAKRMRARFARG